MRRLQCAAVQGRSCGTGGHDRDQVPTVPPDQPAEACEPSESARLSAVGDVHCGCLSQKFRPAPWPFPLRRLWRSRARPRDRRARLSNCLFRRAGEPCSGHSRGTDGRQGPGSRACLERSQILRRQALARQGSYPHCRISLPAVQHGRKAPRRRRPAALVAGSRADHRRSAARRRVCRERRRAHRSGTCRRRRRASPLGLQPKSGPVHSARSGRSPSASPPLHLGLRRQLRMRVTCPM